MLVLGETLFFAADDGIHGRELWRSDVATPGARLVRDIRPGAGSALWESTHMVAMNGALYFFASSNGSSLDVWRSDGTAEGTFGLRSLHGSEGWFDTRGRLIVHGNTLFIATPNSLWKSDGTPAGTVVIRDDICVSTVSSERFAVMGDVLFFVGGEYTNRYSWPPCTYELMRSDGTTEGTFLVKAISNDEWFGPGSLGYYTHLIVVNNTLFFQAFDRIHGRELWKSDGTAEGTVMLKDIAPGPNSSLSPHHLFTIMGQTIFFMANDSVHGNELWRSDGTAEGTIMVRDIHPGLPNSLDYSDLTSLQTSLFFNVYPVLVLGLPGGLWRSDGTAEGTVQVLPEIAFARAEICGQTFITSSTNLYVLLSDPNRCTIRGRVTDNTGRGVAGATVRAGERSATTDADGFYALSGLPTGTYTLTATLSGYQITPVSRTVTLTGDVSGQDFSAAPLTYRISGRVSDGAGRGVAGATVRAGERSATTDADGFYALTDLPADDYTLTASKSGCTIAPPQRTVTVPPDGVNQDFNAVCLTERVFLPLIVR
jgi:ELWxxDGT repeat protein